ncbi:MAG: hypothetical protein BroJett011_62950 [Chloroflexota bacterium]|nr:MAG: hypothetical protein BroJett011_62950 [Chloroflexota bacterium]
MDNNLYLLRGGGVKVAVQPQIFKHGGGIYLAFTGDGVNIPFLAAADVAAAVLRQVLALVEKAIADNDQGHISRTPAGPERQPTIADLNGDPRHDFAVFVRRFARSSPDVVAAIAQLYKSQGYKVPGVDAILQAYEDVDAVAAIRHQLINSQGELLYGARNRIAKTLGIRDAGNYRARIDTLIWLLKGIILARLEDFEPPLEDSRALLEDSGPKPAVSNSSRQWKKAANQ